MAHVLSSYNPVGLRYCLSILTIGPEAASPMLNGWEIEQQVPRIAE